MGGTVTSDLFTTATPALEFTMDAETWIIAFSIVVFSQQDNGVFSDNTGSALINSGNISGFFSGVSFQGAGGAITNNAGHHIVGGGEGILLGADGQTVTNHGTVLGLGSTGVQFATNSNHVVLNNDGEIYGQTAGVIAGSSLEGGNVFNSGLIRSDVDGIFVQTGDGLKTTIDNAATGIIAGSSLAIHTLAGAISLNNRGTVQGAILCQGLNAPDTIVNTGKIVGDVALGSGNDTFNGAGGTSGKVFGGVGIDTLLGGSAADILDGGVGVDLLVGRLGRDTLTGGDSNDRFDFNSIKESVVGANRDVIQDFSRADVDKIDLRDIDAKTGVANNNAFKFIGKQDFHDVKGELRYKDLGAMCLVQGDVSGDGKADFEILVKIGSLASGDFLL